MLGSNGAHGQQLPSWSTGAWEPQLLRPAGPELARSRCFATGETITVGSFHSDRSEEQLSLAATGESPSNSHKDPVQPAVIHTL